MAHFSTRPDPGRFESIPFGSLRDRPMASLDQTTEIGGFCPHCQLLVQAGAPAPWPDLPARCPHCHLLIGAGRGLSEPSSEPGAKGTAAGVFSRRAKRGGSDGDAASPEAVLAAIRTVAENRGERPDRLLMVDYQQLAARDSNLPPLHDVFQAFGSWKSARRQAAESRHAGHGGAREPGRG
jgi:hypothetical protein